MRYIYTVFLLAASYNAQAQYEPFKTLEHHMAYGTPPANILDFLCADGSMAEELKVKSNKACEQRLLLIHSQIQSYAVEEQEIFEECDRTVDGLIHEVWACMEQKLNEKYK